MKAIPFILLLFIVQRGFSQSNEALVSNSVIDARHWEINKTSLPLKGLCKFFDGQLLTPPECKTASGILIDFPGLFKSENKEKSGLGYATYLITVIVPTDERDFAVTLPQMYSSYKLWANGEVIATNGIVAKTEEECKPQWRPQTVAFQIQSDTLSLVLQIANFHHAKGGIRESIYLGKSSLLEFKRSVSEVSKFTEASILGALGFLFLVIYLAHQRNKATIYFALLCLTWSVRSLFSNLYLFISIYPDFDWNVMVRIEYITLYLAMIWAILFLTSLFFQETNVIIKYGLVFCNILFAAFTMSSTPRLFTQGLNVYLIVSGVLLIYSGYVVIRAWINERTGSGLLTISIILGLNIFGYDIFVYEGFSSYDPVIFSVGYVSIFILMSLALAFHVGLIKTKASATTKLTYDDLYKDQML